MTDPHSHRAPAGAPPTRPDPWRSRIAAAFRIRYASYGEHGLVWRLLTPAVFILAGALFAASAHSSKGTDLRPGRYDDLSDLALSRSDRIADLNQERAEIQADIDRMTQNRTGVEIDEMNRTLEGLRGPAGLQKVKGPGITITLDDAPERVLDDEDGETKAKLVHQQDIQAVANALWAGGAEAVTVQGKRIVSSTGIKCVGSNVLLQGVFYPPPYVISAIGDTTQMLSRVDRDPVINRYLQYVEEYQLGWDLELEDELRFPAYDGSVETVYARPLVTEDEGNR